MGILGTIRGKPSKKAEPSIAEAEAALSRAAAGESDAKAEIASAQARRRELLLVDGSDDQIIAADKAIASSELDLDGSRLHAPRCSPP